MAILAAWLAMVPGTFWGVIIGAFFSLGGVVLTNRSSEKRLRDQFSNDRTLRMDEREHGLRRDVYLVATEALATGVASIAKFVDLDTPTADLSKIITEQLPVLSKVQIIGGPDVLKTTNDVTNELSAVFQRLMAHRILLSLMSEGIRNLEQQIVAFTKQQEHSLESMKSFNLSGEVDKRRWDVIQANHKFETDRIAEAESSKARLYAQMTAGQLTYSKECIQELHALGLLRVPALAAMRGELGFPLDKVAYTKTVHAAHAKQMSDLEHFLEQMRTFIVQPPGKPSG